jgi:hypothetical protein
MKHCIILLGILLLISVGCKSNKTDCDCSIIKFEKIKKGMSKEFVEMKILKTKAVKVDYIYHTYKCPNNSDFINIQYVEGKVNVTHFNDSYYPK